MSPRPTDHVLDVGAAHAGAKGLAVERQFWRDEALRARSEEARLLEEGRAKDEMLAEAFRTPTLLAWRAGSPHGFSRVYADTEEQARERGAVAQRCEVGAINVDRWPEEDLCKAKQVAGKDIAIQALVDALSAMHGQAALFNRETDSVWRSVVAQMNTALRLVGR